MTSDPIVVEQTVVAHEARLRLRIPADLEYFAGHFPAAPVVPGIVQIKWAVEAGQRLLGVVGAPARMEAIKFAELMTPDLTVVLALKWAAGDGKLYFTYENEGARFSSGRFVYRQTR